MGTKKSISEFIVSKKLLYGFLVATLLSGCVQFKEASLYVGEERLPPSVAPSNIKLLIEPVIFANSAKDVWGLEKNACLEGSLISDMVHSGTKAIKLNWNRSAPGCTWAGIGIGWDSYAGKDLSEVMDHAAIQMHVRSQKGKMFGLPFVLTLEDYSGGMGFCYTANKYFERTAIDENWQKVIVPLRDFDIQIENLDVTNIKQLMIELQQSGAVYIDDIELILYTPEPTAPWMKEEKLPDPTALPIVLFENQFINNHGWGMMKDECRNLAIIDGNNQRGKVIQAKWNASETTCHALSFGVSWNKWFPTDITSILSRAEIYFELKLLNSKANESLSIQVGMEDYDRQKSFVTVQRNQLNSSPSNDDWTKIQIPLSALQGNADLKRVKHMYFSLEGSGDVLFDSIQIRKAP